MEFVPQAEETVLLNNGVIDHDCVASVVEECIRMEQFWNYTER